MNEDKYKIEKNIKIPKRKGGYSSKYPWDEMEIGDSFLFTKDIKSGSIYSLVSQSNAKRSPKHFAAREVDGGIRIWRTK